MGFWDSGQLDNSFDAEEIELYKKRRFLFSAK